MRNFTLTTVIFVALVCLGQSFLTTGLPKKVWPKPSELAASHHQHKDSHYVADSQVGLTSSSALESNAPPPPSGFVPQVPNIPGVPNIPIIPIIPAIPFIPAIPGIPAIPRIPNIPTIPSIPGIPNIPGLPNFPSIPNILGLPSLPGLPKLPGLPPLPHFQSAAVVSKSDQIDKCFTKDGLMISDRCFSQILASYKKNDFALDKECCGIVVNMDKKCESYVHMLFKNPLFATLLRHSCRIHLTKN